MLYINDRWIKDNSVIIYYCGKNKPWKKKYKGILNKFYNFYDKIEINKRRNDKNCSTYIYDGSLVMENLLLAAHSLNIGSFWIYRAKKVFDTKEGKKSLNL